jgi:hypothetical protein
VLLPKKNPEFSSASLQTCRKNERCNRKRKWWSVVALSKGMKVGNWMCFDLMMSLSVGNALLVLDVDGIGSVRVDGKLC